MTAPDPRTAWLNERRTGIGGSDCASLFNVGHGCRRRLHLDKNAVPPDYPDEENDAMALGKILEPFFADKYAAATGRELSSPGSISHPTATMIRVNIDRRIKSTHRSDPGVLEIKAQGRAMFYKTKREGLSEDYILQEQHGILVHGAEWGSFAIGCRDSGELTHWDVERDDAMCAEILREAPKFWAGLSGPPPDRLEPDDKRCQSCGYRKSCQGSALVQIDMGSEFPQMESLRPLLVRYAELDRQYCHQLLDGSRGTAVDAAFEDVKEQIKTALGDHQAVMVGTQKVYFRPSKARELWDTKGLVDKYRKLREEIVLRPEASAIEDFQKQFPSVDSFREEGKAARPLRIYL